jgi:uncharacterized protein YuzE
MRIEYDPDADALYILIREAQVDDNIDIEGGVTVDVDADKHIVGLEILDVSKRLNPSDLSSITIQRLPVEVRHQQVRNAPCRGLGHLRRARIDRHDGQCRQLQPGRREELSRGATL